MLFGGGAGSDGKAYGFFGGEWGEKGGKKGGGKKNCIFFVLIYVGQLKMPVWVDAGLINTVI